MSGETTLTILERTYTELCDREARLLAFGDELQHTTLARKDLEKTLKKLGSRRTRGAAAEPRALPSRTGGNQTPGSSPRERFTERVISKLREHGSLTICELADHMDRDEDDYLRSILTTACLKGQIHQDADDGLYTAAAIAS